VPADFVLKGMNAVHHGVLKATRTSREIPLVLLEPIA
jgi:hypothetical protein